MKKFATVSALCLLLGGCINVDEITLTTQEADALVDNIETAIEAQQEMTKLSLALARARPTSPATPTIRRRRRTAGSAR